MKHCRYCNTDLPAEEFHVRKASPDGLSYRCRDCQRVYSAERYAADPGKAKLRATQWAACNPERRREIRDAYDGRNKLKKTLYMRLWRAANPERAAAGNRLNQHRRRGAGRGDLRALSLITQAARGCCTYCGKSAELTIDHVKPVIAGGDSCWDNVLPACRTCNSSKNRSEVADWLFDRHGIEGLARTIIAMRNVRKIMRRLHPAALNLTEV